MTNGPPSNGARKGHVGHVTRASAEREILPERKERVAFPDQDSAEVVVTCEADPIRFRSDIGAFLG